MRTKRWWVVVFIVFPCEVAEAMSRSERYIAPSAKELERWRQAAAVARQFDRERQELLRASLKKRKKADLVEVALRIAQQDKMSQWLLEQEVGLDKPVSLLVHDIEVAIEIATRVDEARINYNFAFGRRAYEAVRRGLSQLIEKEKIEEAKGLALKLMREGSYQIECSDEGLMQEEIEKCLRPLISAVAASSGDGEWAREMLRCDPTGCICRQELTELADRSMPEGNTGVATEPPSGTKRHCSN
jgi:hypothetical protein